LVIKQWIRIREPDSLEMLDPHPDQKFCMLFKIILVYREPLRLQMKVFMDEVQQQLMLPTIRSVTGIKTVKKGSVVRSYGDLRHD
jgi:hypothetical protein